MAKVPQVLGTVAMKTLRSMEVILVSTRCMYYRSVLGVEVSHVTHPTLEILSRIQCRIYLMFDGSIYVFLIRALSGRSRIWSSDF